ncbi:MAG: hypothetical protein IAE80_17255 [Anaerolinea sp.]|nr:hypothetical protein [Anaerolinea sp.]
MTDHVVDEIIEQVDAQVAEWSIEDQIRLIERLLARMKTTAKPSTPRKSLYGLWEGVEVSAEDIDEARREMWGNFPREDI